MCVACRLHVKVQVAFLWKSKRLVLCVLSQRTYSDGLDGDVGARSWRMPQVCACQDACWWLIAEVVFYH
jgi:hypothetical protein